MTGTGIFCLEGEWGKNLRTRLSVEPQLAMLKEAGQVSAVVHRDVATRADFHYYLNTWLGRGYSAYPLGYLAFHGSRRTLWFPNDEDVTLDEIVEIVDGRGQGRTLYLGSCAVMAGPHVQVEERLSSFCQDTGFKALVGYTKNVEWFEAAAFDFLLLPTLLHGGRINDLNERLGKRYGRLVETLGLRIATRTKVQTWTASAGP